MEENNHKISLALYIRLEFSTDICFSQFPSAKSDIYMCQKCSLFLEYLFQILFIVVACDRLQTKVCGIHFIYILNGYCFRWWPAIAIKRSSL